MELINGNLCIVMSDTHFGHDDCLYDTFWSVVAELIEKIEELKKGHDIKNTFLILNGDTVSGTDIYRNQYLDNNLNKNEEIILFGAYMIHMVLEKLEKAVGQQIKVIMVSGNHEGSRKSLPQNFVIGISRRLESYGHFSRYTSNHAIINIAHELSDEDFNICAFHGWGGADYSSITPSLVRELTRFHSQTATDKGIIIKRFTVGHSLHPNRNIVIERNGIIESIKIGDFVNEFNPNICKSIYDKKIKTLVFNDGNIQWEYIDEVSKHVFNGDLLHIESDFGGSVVTPEHSIYTYSNGKITLKKASELTLEDELIHVKNINNFKNYFTSAIKKITKIPHNGFVYDIGVNGINNFFDAYGMTLVHNTHWLEVDRFVLGVRIDVTGGFQRWPMKMSYRESGMFYYVYSNDDCKITKISGLKYQLDESKSQRLHTKNRRYTADILDEAIDYEIELGLLRPRDVIERK